jgi:hypothetical protein
MAPMDIAPILYRKSLFKKRLVARELLNKSWMLAASHISSREELFEFVNLWALLRNVYLNELERDSIRQQWSSSGEFSMALVYKIQFQGSCVPFKIGHLWKAKAKPKVKVFGWTTLPTTETLVARGMQGNQTCVLCNSDLEDAHHLLTDCPFSRQVIHFIWAWHNFTGGPMQMQREQGATVWLTSSAVAATASMQRETTEIPLYCWWNICKCNRRVFEAT